jgi:hypothetical protein
MTLLKDTLLPTASVFVVCQWHGPSECEIVGAYSTPKIAEGKCPNQHYSVVELVVDSDDQEDDNEWWPTPKPKEPIK